MSQHPRDTNPIEWLKAENMLLAIVLKAMMAKLPPEVKAEPLKALTSFVELPQDRQASPEGRLVKIVAVDLMTRLDSRLQGLTR